MKEVLLIIAGMSICGSAAFLLYLLTERLIARGFGSGRRYVFLRFAMLGFILPMFFAISRVIPASQRPTTVERGEVVMFYPASVQVESVVTEYVSVTDPQTANLTPQISIDLIGVLITVWIVGAAAVFCIGLLSFLRFRIRLSRSLSPIGGEEKALLEKCKALVGVSRDVGLYRSECVPVPTVIGFLCPMILLPQKEVSQKSLEYVFRHELIHLRRGDLFAKALVSLAAALHWFNPLVWLFRREFIKQLELSCDETAAKNMSYAERKEYCLAILEAVPIKRTLQASPGLVFVSSGKQKLERRLDNMLNCKPLKKTHKIIAAVVAAAVLISVCTVVGFMTPSLKQAYDNKVEQLMNMTPEECVGFVTERGVKIPENYFEDTASVVQSYVRLAAENPENKSFMAISATDSAVLLADITYTVRNYLDLDNNTTIEVTADNLSEAFNGSWADSYYAFKLMTESDKKPVAIDAEANAGDVVTDEIIGDIGADGAQEIAFRAVNHLTGGELDKYLASGGVKDLVVQVLGDSDDLRYAVSFTMDNTFYRYVIKGLTGEILSPREPSPDEIPGLDEAWEMFELIKQWTQSGVYVAGYGIGLYEPSVLIEADDVTFSAIRDRLAEMGYNTDMLERIEPFHTAASIRDQQEIAASEDKTLSYYYSTAVDRGHCVLRIFADCDYDSDKLWYENWHGDISLWIPDMPEKAVFAEIRDLYEEWTEKGEYGIVGFGTSRWENVFYLDIRTESRDSCDKIIEKLLYNGYNLQKAS